MVETRSQKRKRNNSEELELSDYTESEGSECVSELEEILCSIYDGGFFENEIMTETAKSIRNLSPIQYSKILKMLNNIREEYAFRELDIVKILESKLPEDRKVDLLECVCNLMCTEPLSEDYDHLVECIKYYMNTDSEAKRPKIPEKSRISLDTIVTDLDDKSISKTACLKIVDTLETTDSNKDLIKRKMNTFFSSASEDNSKYKTWLQTVFSIPFGKYSQTTSSLDLISSTLDSDILYLDTVKDSIMCIPNFNSGCILALHGEKGTGKSTVVSSIAKALGRPFKMISLGGESDSSNLLGHNFTYVGSKVGKIVDTLISSKVMNPVVLIDELDKVSDSSHSKEVIGALMHIIDQSTNKYFNGDKYLSGLTVDLSKVIFVFTFNDISLVDGILGDRIQKIHVPDYNKHQKLRIIREKIIPKLGIDLPIEFTDGALEYLISHGDTGLRTIKQYLYTIFTRVNLLSKVKSTVSVKLGYKTHKSFIDTSLSDGKIVLDVGKCISLLEGYTLTDSIPFGMYI